MRVARKIIVLRESSLDGVWTLPRFIVRMGIEINDIWMTERLDFFDIPNRNILTFIKPYLENKFLTYLEFHIADTCNLNCRGCSHYASLARKEHYPNIKFFANDLQMLHLRIEDILIIRILGGEPLLNRDIEEYIKVTRKFYPQSELWIVTNGLLLMKMPDSFYETLLEERCKIGISFYPALTDKIQEICVFLKNRNISCYVSPMIKEFILSRTINPRDDKVEDIFLNCASATCNNLYEGKIAACYLPFVTKYFNSYFKQNFPEDGQIDLYDSKLTTAELKQKLMMPFENCRYCLDSSEYIKIPWSSLKYPSCLSDWIAM